MSNIYKNYPVGSARVLECHGGRNWNFNTRNFLIITENILIFICLVVQTQFTRNNDSEITFS